MDWEAARQDGYAFRTVRTWPVGEQPVDPVNSTGYPDGSAYGSGLTTNGMTARPSSRPNSDGEALACLYSPIRSASWRIRAGTRASWSAAKGEVSPAGARTRKVKIDFDAGRSFAVIEAEQAAGVAGPPAHVHRAYDEAWYVIEGTMEFQLGGRTYACPSGSVVSAPRGTAHTFRNPGPEPARMLAILTAEALPLLEELGALVTAGPPDAAAIQAVLARHETGNADAVATPNDTSP